MDTSMPDGSVPTPGESAAGGMPDVPLRRIRSKTPALSHPTVSKPLVPPCEPKGDVKMVDQPMVVNPHEQLKLVEPKTMQSTALCFNSQSKSKMFINLGSTEFGRFGIIITHFVFNQGS